jgi:HEAT repeat protein
VDDLPPHMAYVSNDGKHVVLRDAYSRLGRGKVLVFLNQQGKILRTYELSDFLTMEQIVMETRNTRSSVWWSEPGWFSYLRNDTRFAFFTLHGIIQCFDVADGSRIALDEKGIAEIRVLVGKAVAAMLAGKTPPNSPKSTEAKWYEDPDKAAARARERARLCEAGATLAGALKAKEFVPALKKLLRDRTVTGQCSSGEDEWCDYYGVQVEAAKALGKLLDPNELVALIEPLLADSTYAVREDLLDAILAYDGGYYGRHDSPNSACLLAIWHRLAKHPVEDVRQYAVRAVAARESADYMLAHPELLDHADETVRCRYVQKLARSGDKRAIPLLRKALNDEFSPTRSSAFCGLIKCNPPDIEKLLHDGLKDGNLRLDAMTELVRRGDKGAIDMLCRNLALLKDHTHDREGWGTQEMAASDMCNLVVELRIKQAEPALRQAYQNDCDRIKRPVAGALAALGDKEALARLREFAVGGDAFARAGSIRMLAAIGDKESLSLIRPALDDREPMVRRAAKKALARLGEPPRNAPEAKE